MNFRSFDDDLENSDKLPNIEWEKVIKKCFGNDCKIQWKTDKISQLDFGSDLIIKIKNGRKFSADKKKRNISYFNYPLWLLEIIHHRYTEKECINKISTVPGWLYSSTADLIIVGTHDDKELSELCIFSLYPFKDLKFAKILNKLEIGYAGTRFKNGIYQKTLNKKIPLELLKGYANFFWYWNKNNGGNLF